MSEYNFLAGAICGFVVALIMGLIILEAPGDRMYEWCATLEVNKDE